MGESTNLFMVKAAWYYYIVGYTQSDIAEMLGLSRAKVVRLLDEAREQGATGVFASRYGEIVKVYTIGNVSKEICGGPHAGNTAELVSFKIQKEESSSSGVRRIKAVIGAK